MKLVSFLAQFLESGEITVDVSLGQIVWTSQFALTLALSRRAGEGISTVEP
jgi:hypothetical protein